LKSEELLRLFFQSAIGNTDVPVGASWRASAGTADSRESQNENILSPRRQGAKGTKDVCLCALAPLREIVFSLTSDNLEGCMEEEIMIRSYFKRQVREVIARSTSDPEGFLSYFVEHEPKDEEILGLLAISTLANGDTQVSEVFPTSVEALAALSPNRQAELCREFRKELKNCLRQISAA
jgi:hypothetical protein